MHCAHANRYLDIHLLPFFIISRSIITFILHSFGASQQSLIALIFYLLLQGILLLKSEN